MGCGICGFVGLSDKQLLNQMCDSIHHRGPDETGTFLDTDLGLGIDRLKVIDLNTGDQPIHNEDMTKWIVFNGEIYNYRELQTSLQALGHRFYTASDTECIVHAYEEWGDACVQHLRGMFAFAIWDTKRKRLYIARDRFGKKPLYYALVGKTLLFASEMKAILKHPGVSREIDYKAVDLFFTYMYVPSPNTIFAGVRKLPPASFATFEGGKLNISTYWDFVLRPDESLTEDLLVDSLYKAIEDSVRVRMRSDVPLGAFLSGGIDSSTVVSFMSRLSDIPVKTVSIGFDDGFNETSYARLVADALKTDHKEYTVTADAFKILPRLVWHFDEPFADHSMVPTYYLSEVTRREVTVALSGDGGDELFMGYPYLLDPPSYAFYSKLPRSIRRPVLRALTSLPLDKGFRRMAKHAYDKDYGGQSFAERFVMRVTLNDGDGLRRLYSKEHAEAHGVSDTYGYVLGLAKECKSQDPLDTVDYATVRGYLEEDILVKVDRMSMAVSLEARCPLLDHEFADLVGRIPSRMKMRGRETKYIMKKMASKKELIPREIIERSKQGFGAPIESWMKGEWKEIVSQLLDPVISHNYTGMFDPQHVRSLVAEPYLNSNRLFALMTFILWYKLYVEADSLRQPPMEVMTV